MLLIKESFNLIWLEGAAINTLIQMRFLISSYFEFVCVEKMLIMIELLFLKIILIKES